MAVSLRQNAGWALAGNVAYAACQAGVLVALAKLAGASDVGRFALGLAIAAPIVLFANLHLRAVQATDACRTYDLGTYLGLRLIGIGAALAAIVVVAAGYDGATARVIVAVGLAKSVEAVSDVLFGRLQQAEDLRRIALSLMAKGVASVAVVALVVVLTRDVAAAALALAGAWALVVLAVDLPAVRRFESARPRFEPRALASLAWLALPLGGVMGLNALMVSVPRYAVEHALGPAALGHFAALAYLLIAVNQPMLAVGAATSPRLARHFAADRRAYARVTRRTLALALLFGLAALAGAALLGGRLLALLYTPEYARHADVLVWLALAATAGMSASAFGYALTAARRFPQQLGVALAGVAVCALASHWLVPRYGLLGAAWAVLATETCRLACLALLYRGTLRASETVRDARARRVLHVFGTMDRGGAESRTLEVMRHAVARGYRFDFCVLGEHAGAYAPEIERLGGHVHRCPLRANPLAFAFRFRRLLAAGGYDVVHSHVHQFSGIVLLIARTAGVPTRIAHLRSSHDGYAATPRRRAYRRCMRALIDRQATHVVGVSASAMHAFWGADWARDRRRVVIYNGVEETPQASAAERSAARRELGLEPDARLVLHVGRFAPAKNHEALVGVAAELERRGADAVLVLVGDGARRPAIERAVAEHGLARRVRFLGARDDVPRWLRAADVLVHPSHWEGLPGAVLEALGAGLPVVASPIPPVVEIACQAAGITLADPEDAPAFADAIETVLAEVESASAPVPPLPMVFRTATSTERLLACYQ